MSSRASPGDLPSKLTTRVRARGFRELLDLVVDRTGETLRSDDVLLFFVRDAGGDVALRDDLEFVEATVSHAAGFAADIGTDSVRTFTRRLDSGDRCFLVIAGGRIAHATWMTATAAWTRELRRYFRPPHGDAYVYESFTRADFRGRGIYPFALRAICARLGHEGMERVWVGVLADNAPSQRAVAKAGFDEAFRVSYGRRFGILSLGSPEGPLADLANRCLTRRP